MKKSMLVQQIAQKTGLPKSEVEIIINTMLDTITESLKAREAVSFIGFGSFVPVKKNAREIYIPGTTTKVKVEEKYGVRFKPSKKLKAILENETQE
ncbi:MAG: HU family DNA-binding protein [Epsilonproteobacteria bacterium]|nr:HU family DNA-binding protein [Campylobacterota bacterium]